jgi:hypothetical protein
MWALLGDECFFALLVEAMFFWLTWCCVFDVVSMSVVRFDFEGSVWRLICGGDGVMWLELLIYVEVILMLVVRTKRLRIGV